MSKALIDLDEELLARAKQVPGIDARKATVNSARREAARRAAAMHFLELARAGSSVPACPVSSVSRLAARPVGAAGRHEVLRWLWPDRCNACGQRWPRPDTGRTTPNLTQATPWDWGLPR